MNDLMNSHELMQFKRRELLKVLEAAFGESSGALAKASSSAATCSGVLRL
jgi:hypothetical protein